MASLPEQFDREGMLLMYLADELPSNERAEVENRLRADDSLAAELDRIRRMRDEIEAALKSFDRAGALPMSCETAVRRASRAMKQWHVDRFAKPPAAAPMRRPFHLPWWAYASGVAAAIIVGVVIWASNIANPGTQASNAQLEQQSQIAQDLDKEWGKGAERDAELADAGNSLPPSASSTDQLMDEIFMRTDQR